MLHILPLAVPLTLVAQVAIVYLVTSALAIAIFAFDGYWIYYYVDLDTDALLDPGPLMSPIRSDSFR